MSQHDPDNDNKLPNHLPLKVVLVNIVIIIAATHFTYTVYTSDSTGG